ncbi:hypothetical protein D9619_002574 [Psilocybe cf. subviscida]|uniref:Uncharacterized protein n=1 Tax=Psilocybe cf. subviscida TaxID=2480587 RepID=A0A8H5EU58_9AGAR|nr:hypothetical protein D9619_002574 [Psilocybe cf. subviscida]
MPTTTSNETELIIEGTTMNAVNNTKGGAIFEFNRSLTAADYEHLVGVFTTGSNGQSGAESQVSAMPSPLEQDSCFLSQFLHPARSVTIRDSMINGINNTTGGLIVHVKSVSQDQ